MRNLGNPRYIASCHFTKYGPSCKSCSYNIKVFSENMSHYEPINFVIIKNRSIYEFMISTCHYLFSSFSFPSCVSWCVSSSFACAACHAPNRMTTLTSWDSQMTIGTSQRMWNICAFLLKKLRVTISLTPQTATAHTSELLIRVCH